MEILVVGGGPSGLTAAREAALNGAKVTLIEEDREIGKPDHCAGLVSINGLRNILPNYEDVVINKIRKVRIFSPMGKEYEILPREYKAVVVDREKLDLKLMEMAERADVKIITNTQFNPSFRYYIMINAEGVKARICRRFGLEIPKSLPAIQFDLELSDFEKDTVEIYTGSMAPGFFAWLVPRYDHVRVGLASEENPKKLLMNFIEKRFRAKILKTLWGKVVIGGPVNKAVRGRLVSIGDAGGFAKPTTGGGIIFGCLTAKIAGKMAALGKLSDFDREWKRIYLKEFRKMILAAKIFRNMNYKELERVLEEINNSGLFEELASYDMDFQGSAILRIATSRVALSTLSPFLRLLKVYILEKFL
ncbi:MAG: NAD(P)/FAD-dependent oxidoreductase [Candidatus Methanomethyliaceae archaeon]|nr:NAD(P)/FAD-dependent oxidoreductase [Candidatus Methanomethyliaceae archaeon]